MNKKKYLLFAGMILAFLVLVWLMFQPLMSAYAEGVLESGEIYVYGVGFLTGFGLQGGLTVVSPFLLMLLTCINMRKKHKTWLWLMLIIANVLAYVRSWFNAKQWLATAVGSEIHYYVGSFMYPCLMAVSATLVLLWIYCYDGDDTCVEWEDGYESDV